MQKKFSGSGRKAPKIIALIFALVLSFSVFTACSNRNKPDVTANLSIYTIDAILNDENKTLDVKQSIEYTNNYDVELSELYFHLYPNAYREGARFSPFAEGERNSAYPNGISHGGIEINSLKVDGVAATVNIGGQDEDILIVPFKDILMPTEKTVIEMEYRLNVPNVRHRFGYFNKTINLGNFYPIACIYENGEFESSPYYSNGDPFYSQIADYNVSITAPSKYTAAMSGKASVTPINTAANKYSAKIEAARDFSIVLGEFQTKTTTALGAEVTYYYYDDETPENSLSVAADSVVTFSSMFGGYPYKSLAVVQTHFLAGGMEYPGLVYISDAQKGDEYRDVIVHEVAHQWWYGVVGNNQITHAWLDETLAEYSATLFYQANTKYNVNYSARISGALKNYALFCDLFAAGLDTSITRKLPDYRTSLEYAMMTYTKGQIMMDSLRKTIGDTAFFKALKNYYSDNYFSIAKPDNLIAAFENASKKDLSSFFATWMDGNVLTYGKT